MGVKRAKTRSEAGWVGFGVADRKFAETKAVAWTPNEQLDDVTEP